MKKYLLYQLPDENHTYTSDKSVKTVQKTEIRQIVFAELEPKKLTDGSCVIEEAINTTTTMM